MVLRRTVLIPRAASDSVGRGERANSALRSSSRRKWNDVGSTSSCDFLFPQRRIISQKPEGPNGREGPRTRKEKEEKHALLRFRIVRFLFHRPRREPDRATIGREWATSCHRAERVRPPTVTSHEGGHLILSIPSTPSSLIHPLLTHDTYLQTMSSINCSNSCLQHLRKLIP